nr:hypothetical protein [uncultured Acidocella sp.]
MTSFTAEQMHRPLFEEPGPHLERASSEDGPLGFMIGGMANLGPQHIGQQYYDAAVLLLEAIKSGDATDDQIALPALYLYRHSVELFLKAALGNTAKTHDLAALAAQFKALIKAEFDADLPAWIDNRINELASIDPSSTAFRYSETWSKAAKKNVPLEGEFHVDLAHLKDAMWALNVALLGVIASVACGEGTGSRDKPKHPLVRAFSRYIGIDYSGAETPNASLKGLRVYLAEGDAQPEEVLPPAGTRKYWSRRGIAEWLVARLNEDVPTLVGIDHGFSFPLRYFESHHLLPDWPSFLDDFQRHWPTDEDDTYVDFIRHGNVGNGAARQGNTRWRRLAEQRAGGAKSVFHFDVQGSVAKSTHAGIPWLRFIRQQLGAQMHFWPFDGWAIPPGHSAIAEVYPALWSKAFPNVGRTGDQHDAFSIAAWLSHADRNGSLTGALHPNLTPAEQTLAQVEGWILGVR